MRAKLATVERFDPDAHAAATTTHSRSLPGTTEAADDRHRRSRVRAAAEVAHEAMAASLRSVRQLVRTEVKLWGAAELLDAATRHPLSLPELVSLVLATGSPTWTYSMRQLWRLFDAIDGNCDGQLTLVEIEQALEGKVHVRAFVASIGNATLEALLTPPFEQAERAFRRIDTDSRGFVNRAEWLLFIDEARALRLKYYKVKADIFFRLYNPRLLSFAYSFLLYLKRWRRAACGAASTFLPSHSSSWHLRRPHF
jgi:hypothetical protein